MTHANTMSDEQIVIKSKWDAIDRYTFYPLCDLSMVVSELMYDTFVIRNCKGNRSPPRSDYGGPRSLVWE